MGRTRFHRGSHPALLAMVVLAVFAAPGWGAPRERADLYLWLDSRGAASVLLRLDFEPPRPLALEQAVSAALGAPLQDPSQETEDGRRTLSAGCEHAFRRRGMIVEGQVDPAPLLDLLRPQGVRWLTVNISHPRAGFSRCPGARPVPAGRRSSVACFWPILVPSGSSPLHMAFGYRSRDWLLPAAVLAALLFLPVGLILWKRRWALRATSADPAVVWFGYTRFLRYISIAALPVWAAVIFGFRAEEVAAFALGRAPQEVGIALIASLVLLPPVLALILCSSLSQPVYARLRGIEWTRGELAQRSVWPLIAALAPLLLWLGGLDAGLHGEWRAMVLYLVAGLVCRTVSAWHGMKVLGMNLNALAVGELRDRTFSLAEKAGVKVQQVYVLPAGKGRVANAFAMRGNNVLLTDYLLQHLSKREVEAIVAHELAHLKRQDPGKLRLVLAVLIAVPIGVFVGVSVFTQVDPTPWILPALIGLALSGFYFFSRGRERGADAGAVALTGDAEAVITSLAKITRLNLMPLQWGKWDERFLTHPSTLKRVQAIAERNGISPERLQEILASPSSEEERYTLPPTFAGEERLFSTAFKGQVLTAASWALALVIALTPAVAPYLTTRANLEGAGLVAAGLGGLAATVALYLLANNSVPLWGYRSLQRRLRERMKSAEVWAERGEFVGFAPAPSPRIYEGYYDWDVGFLFIAADRLSYVGEQTRFALRPDQVAEVRLGPGGPGWGRAPRIYLTWRDGAREAGGAFSLRPAGARSMRQLSREVRSLAKRLQTWREQPAATAAPLSMPSDFETPSTGAVTSVSPRAVFNSRAFLRSLFLMLMLAAGASVLLGLPFDPDQGRAAWYVILVAEIVAVFQWLPHLIYREPDSAMKATIPAPGAPEV